MFIFLILLILNIDELASIWSALIGIFASLFFSAVVSYIVQKINDEREKNNILTTKNLIRLRELEKLSTHINSFISTYHDCETELNKKFNIIKDSFDDQANTMDLNIIIQNLYLAEELKKEKLDEDAINKLNDYSFNSERIKNVYNEMATYLEKQATRFTALNDMSHIEIFDKEEIGTLSMILSIKENQSVDVVQVKIYLECLFSLIKKFDLKIDIYVNYEWIIVAVLLLEIYSDKADMENKAKKIVKEYLDNRN